jgi:hypothetical protein
MLREEHRRVFENQVLWGKFGPMGDGVTESWRKLLD